MKTDETVNEKGVLNSIIKSFKSGTSCCPSDNCCCCPGTETGSKDKKVDSNKRLDIEWKHFAVGDATCERCGKTGEALNIAVNELQQELTSSGVIINSSEILLDKARIGESNEIRMNGRLLEDLLTATVVSTECPSCGTLAGEESTCCRATEIEDTQYEDVPVWAIKKGAYQALDMEMPT